MAKNRKIDDSTKGMSRGLIYFFFSTMQSSILGLLMAIVGFIFLYTTVWLIAKALFVYLAGYIGITFMMIFAPIFLPLVLLRATKEYFNKWVKLTISFALQPVIILVFISFSITAIDLAVFSGDYSVMYRIAGDASRESTFNINKYLEEKQIVLEKPAMVAGVRTEPKVPELEKSNNTDFIKGFRDNKKCLDAMMKGDDSATTKAECESYYPLQWWRKSINWKKMAEVRQPEVADPGAETNDPKDWTAEDRKGRAMAREVFASVLFMAMVVAIMNGLLNIVPMVANDLVGESFQSPNLAGSIGQKGGVAGNISSMVSQQIRTMSGGRR